MKTQPTRSQQRILRLLKKLNRAISAQDLYVELRKGGKGLGLATVYRSLEALKLQGLVQTRKLPNGESLYSSVNNDQHYLTCLDCGESIPINQCPVHQLETELQTAHQFKVFYHTLEFFGLCHRCVAANTIEAAK
ncbi:MAG: transcriptional repressor [Symploca sp. SIO1A3]|nr:transcriptional repressor [Symploca sp. SIO1A3]